MSRSLPRLCAAIFLLAPATGCGDSREATADSLQRAAAAPSDSQLADSLPREGASPMVADSGAALTVEGDGLRIFLLPSGSARPLPFGMPSADVVAVLTRVLGTGPAEEGENPDCGIRFATWANDLSLSFSQSGFAGWSIRGNSDFTTASGIGIGSSRSELESAYDTDIRRTSLGEEFTAGGLAGVLDSSEPDAHVRHMWAGQVCLAR